LGGHPKKSSKSLFSRVKKKVEHIISRRPEGELHQGTNTESEEALMKSKDSFLVEQRNNGVPKKAGGFRKKQKRVHDGANR